MKRKKRKFKELTRLYALVAATFDTTVGVKQELKRMSAEVDALKAAVAEVKTAVVHTPGMLENLVAKAEAAFASLEKAAVADVEAVEADVVVEVDKVDKVDKVEGKTPEPAPAADKDAPVPGAADDEPPVVKEVADGAK